MDLWSLLWVEAAVSRGFWKITLWGQRMQATRLLDLRPCTTGSASPPGSSHGRLVDKRWTL